MTPAATQVVHRRLPWPLSRWLAAGMAAITLAVLPLYTGSTLIFLAFGIASIALAVVGGIMSQSCYCRLLAIFLCLGFWAKLVIHLLGDNLIEPVGAFNYLPGPWDRVLLVSTLALASTTLAIALCGVLDRCFALPKVEKPSNPVAYAFPLFAMSAAVAVVLFGLNYWYAILKIGHMPRLQLNSYIHVAVSFIVSWGAMLWLGALAFWLVQQGRWPILAIFLVAAVEGALASASMASRAQMFVHVIAVGMFYVLWRHRLQLKISARDWIKIAIVTGLLFVTSLAAVSIARLLLFPTAALASEITSAPRLSEAAPSANAPTPARAGPPAALTDERSLAAKADSIRKELTLLLVNRWIGLEGVMAISSSDQLGMPLLFAILKERPDAGTNAIYQRISHSHYQQLRDFVFLTLPGPAAIFFSTGNLLILSLGMMLLIFAGYAIERVAELWTMNPVASSITGCALAFLVSNMNFPHTLFYFTLLLCCALGFITLYRIAGQHWSGTSGNR